MGTSQGDTGIGGRLVVVRDLLARRAAVADGGLRPASSVVAAIGLALFVLAIWPVGAFVHLGMQDYPNHLARGWILTHLDEPSVAAQFRAAWSVVPNLAFDLWMVAVGRLLDVWDAGRLYVVVTALLTVGGVAALSWALRRRIGLPQLLALPLIFNSGFDRGFLSFNLAMALMLFAAAWWEAIDERRPWLRGIGGAIFCLLLYTSHLAGFGAYGLWVIGARLRDLGRGGGMGERLRGWARDAVQIVPVVGLLVFERATRSEWAVIDTSARGFEDPLVRLGQIERLLDIGPWWHNAAALTLVIGLLLPAWAVGALRIDRRALPAIFMALVLYAITPNSFGGVHMAGWRPLLVAALFLAASLETSILFGRRPAIAWVAMLVVVVGLASAATASRWAETDRERRDLEAVLAVVKPGERVFVVQTDANRDLTHAERRRRTGIYHLAAYAVIERGIVVQSLFVYPGQQPLRFRDDRLQQAPENSKTTIVDLRQTYAWFGRDLADHVARFDHVLAIGETDAASLPELGRLTPRGHVGLYRLFDPAR